MATDTAEIMAENVKTALVNFDFENAPHTAEMILAIMTEFKAQIAKMTVTHTGVTASACTAGGAVGTETGSGTVA